MRTSIVFLFLILLSFAGCSDDNNGNNNGGVFPNNKTDGGDKTDTGKDMADGGGKTDTIDDDMGKNDMNDMGSPEDMNDGGPDMDMATCKVEDCGAGEDCVEGACKIVSSCEGVQDLGELVGGMKVTESGSFLSSGSDNIESSCAVADALERVYAFTLTSASRVDFKATWLGQFDGVVSIRSTCNDDGSEIFCSDMEVGFRNLSAGTYYLVLEMRVGAPDKFEIELEATPSACQSGDATCSGDKLSFCSGGQPVLYDCADTCSNMACDGDQCAAPVDVPGMGGAFTGQPFDYENNYDFENTPNCSIKTDGYDVVYALGNLTPGTVINVKSSPFNAVFVMKGANSCGDTSGCVAMYDGISDIDYVVPMTEGDEYFVIVDSKLGVQPNPFNHEVRIPNR